MVAEAVSDIIYLVRARRVPAPEKPKQNATEGNRPELVPFITTVSPFVISQACIY
jgi:hypothetical protein